MLKSVNACGAQPRLTSQIAGDDRSLGQHDAVVRGAVDVGIEEHLIGPEAFNRELIAGTESHDLDRAGLVTEVGELELDRHHLVGISRLAAAKPEKLDRLTVVVADVTRRGLRRHRNGRYECAETDKGGAQSYCSGSFLHDWILASQNCN
jgi:hypothetical protein